MFAQWLDVLTGLLLGGMDRWSLLLLLLPIAVLAGLYFGILTPIEGVVFALCYLANIAVRRAIAQRSGLDAEPEMHEVFE